MIMRGIKALMLGTTLLAVADSSEGRPLFGGGTASPAPAQRPSPDNTFQQHTVLPGASVSGVSHMRAGRHLVQQPLEGGAVGSDAPAPPKPAPPKGFVQRNGTGLVLDGQPYHVVGANQCACVAAPRGLPRVFKPLRSQYSLSPLTAADIVSLHPPDYLMLTALTDWDLVVEVLDEAQGLGLNTLRTWAFAERADGDPPDKPALTLQPGVYDETTFRGACSSHSGSLRKGLIALRITHIPPPCTTALDRVIVAAGERGLRLLLALGNNWDAFGGAPQYVAWARQYGGEAEANTTKPAHFFSSSWCRGAYQQFVSTLLGRVNSVSGVRYVDDPILFGFDLLNEPRVEGDSSGEILHAWLDEQSRFVRGLDAWHLITTGSEGYYGLTTPALLGHTPTGDASSGSDFVRNHLLPEVDIAVIHVWPDQWLGCCSAHCLRPFLTAWLDSHVQAATQLVQKPMLVEEFGAKLRCTPSPPSAMGHTPPTPMPPPPLPSPPPPMPSPPPPLPLPPPPVPVVKVAHPAGQKAQRKAKPTAAAATTAAMLPAVPPAVPHLPASPPPASIPPSPPAPPPHLMLRDEVYRTVYASTAGRHTLFWILGTKGIPDGDGYTLFAELDTSTTQVIATHVRAMANITYASAATGNATGQSTDYTDDGN